MTTNVRKAGLVALVAVAAMAIAPVMAAEENARTLFYNPGTGASGAASAGKLAVKFWVEKVEKTRTLEFKPDNVFKTGDEVRVAVEANQDAYVYFFNRDPKGEVSLLYPKQFKATRGKKILAPEDGTFIFKPPAGMEELILVASRKPVAAIEALMGKPPVGSSTAPAPPGNTGLSGTEAAVLAQMRSAEEKNLVFNPGTGTETASYAANSAGGDSVIQTIKLKHTK